jgi:hypothetical protein
MTPDEPRSICDSVHPGGQTKLARKLGWEISTIRRKLAGKTNISLTDELAVKYAIECDRN